MSRNIINYITLFSAALVIGITEHAWILGVILAPDLSLATTNKPPKCGTNKIKISSMKINIMPSIIITFNKS